MMFFTSLNFLSDLMGEVDEGIKGDAYGENPFCSHRRSALIVVANCELLAGAETVCKKKEIFS